MSDLQEKKKQPSRYPLMTVKQAKSTLARLTRDLLNKKIDIQTYRAAAYGLSVQCSLLKFETPEKSELSLSNNNIIAMSPKERQERMTEILRKRIPFYDEYLEYANRKADEINSNNIKQNEIEGIENIAELQSMIASISEGDSDDPMEKLFIAAEKIERVEKPKKETEPPPTSWKQSGIGVKRG